mmetsp:Transcript_17990/g.50484  ORF Transcript_17990/g.50484 Transcript_17990/m.50484 type:complete len:175 (+) Transcript_17990:378-902(+)
MGSFCSLLLAGRVQVTLRLRVLRTAPSPSLTDVMTEVYVDVMGLSLNSGLRGMHVEQGDDAGLRIGPHVELRHEVIHGLRALRRHEGVLARGDDLREQRHLLLVCPLVSHTLGLRTSSVGAWRGRVRERHSSRRARAATPCTGPVAGAGTTRSGVATVGQRRAFSIVEVRRSPQ